MPLKSVQIVNAFNKFLQLRNSNHRYASFDYCYNYFNKFSDKKEIASKDNIEKSCLHLGFYLGSWGMMRASSFLLQESLQFYKPIICWIAYKCPKIIWNIDAHIYNNQNISLLINTYNELRKFIPPNRRELVLVTKILLGVFGNAPAFDDNFTKTFREHYGDNTRYRRFNNNSLMVIKEFYHTNSNLIEDLRQDCRTFDFSSGAETNQLYTRAKIIDMIGFGNQLISD